MQRPSADCGQKQDPGGGMQDAEGKKKRCFRIKEGRKEEKDRGLTFYGPLQKPAFLTKGRCIGVLNLGKCFCDKDFGSRRRAPRCPQSVA
jgi:hypothetical protein